MPAVVKHSHLVKEYQVEYNGQKLTVPVGWPVSNTTAMGPDDAYRFLTDVEKFATSVTGLPDSMLHHDMKYRGLNVPAEYCAPYDSVHDVRAEACSHTEGPWSWSERPAGVNEYPNRIVCHVKVGEGATAGNSVALVSLGGSGAISCREDDIRANAALIAAAPALLKAAEDVIKMNHQYAKDRYGDPMRAEQMACVKVLRKAINQAKHYPGYRSATEQDLEYVPEGAIFWDDALGVWLKSTFAGCKAPAERIYMVPVNSPRAV